MRRGHTAGYACYHGNLESDTRDRSEAGGGKDF